MVFPHLLRGAAIIPVLPAFLQGAVEVRFGSKCEELALSTCFPLVTHERTDIVRRGWYV
jgi:hypothetical protein